MLLMMQAMTNNVEHKNSSALPLALKHLAGVLGDERTKHAHLHMCDHDGECTQWM